MTPSNMPMKKATPSFAEPHLQVRNIALTLFAEQGYQSVSLRKLASALGIQAGSLYNHIASKQDLLFELIDEHETDLLDAIEASVRSNMKPAEQLLAYIRTHIDFNVKHAHRRSITQLEFRNLSPEQQGETLAIRNMQADILSNIIQQGIQQNAFNPIRFKASETLLLAMLNEAAFLVSTDGNTVLDDIIVSLQTIITSLLVRTPTSRRLAAQ
ncbi:TetR family transcriptional regulator [Pseudomonas sp. SJZ079]|nr:TetR family transcriptional regulator [Pseudomonas sp. SJZ079]